MGQSLFFPQQADTDPTPGSDNESTWPESNPPASNAEPSPPDEQPPVPAPCDPPDTQGPTPPQSPLTAFAPLSSESQEQESSLASLRPSLSLDKMKKPGGVWDMEALLGFEQRPGGGAAVSEQPNAPAPSLASPAPPDQPLDPPQAECVPSVPRVSPPPVEEPALESGDSDNSKSSVPTFTPPEGAQIHELSRKQEFNPFQPSPESETMVRKAISVEECSLTTNTVNDELEALQTTVATKSASQTAISPVPAEATAPPTGSRTGLEKQSPGKPSIKQVPIQAAKQEAAQAAPLGDPNSFQLIITPAEVEQELVASVTQTFSISMVHKAVGDDRPRRVNRLRKRQNVVVAARRGKIFPRSTGGAEAKQETDRAKPKSSPALSIQGQSPVFSTPPSRPVPAPPALFNFSQGPRKPEAKPPSETAKGLGTLTGKPSKGQSNSTQPGQPKSTFSSLSTPSSPKPVKMGPTASNSALSPIPEVNPGELGCLTSAPDTNTSQNSPALTSVRQSSNTSLKANRKFHSKTSTVVSAPQHPGSGPTKRNEEKREQAIPAPATPPLPPSPQTAVPASACSSDATPAKPKNKLRFKAPLDVVKFKNPGTAGNKAEKREKKEKRKDGMADFPASPPSPELPQRPSGGWAPFTAEQPCSHKTRCRHQTSTELPPNVTQWLNAKQNYLCEPPWVTTATLAASVAVMLRQDGTYTQP